MRNIKTARGRSLDMGALAKKNEDTLAVGNIRMNARGDRIGSDGSVKKTVHAVAQEQAIAQEVPIVQGLSNAGIQPAPLPTAEPQPEPAPVPEQDLPIVNRQIKEREDGSQYEEIEYVDGSMETVELGNPDEF